MGETVKVLELDTPAGNPCPSSHSWGKRRPGVVLLFMRKLASNGQTFFLPEVLIVVADFHHCRLCSTAVLNTDTSESEVIIAPLGFLRGNILHCPQLAV